MDTKPPTQEELNQEELNKAFAVVEGFAPDKLSAVYFRDDTTDEQVNKAIQDLQKFIQAQ